VSRSGDRLQSESLFKRYNKYRNNISSDDCSFASYSYGKSCTVEVGVVALSTLITHVICIVLEGDTMIYVDQVII